jgi:hypothetical protein
VRDASGALSREYLVSLMAPLKTNPKMNFAPCCFEKHKVRKVLLQPINPITYCAGLTTYLGVLLLYKKMIESKRSARRWGSLPCTPLQPWHHRSAYGAYKRKLMTHALALFIIFYGVRKTGGGKVRWTSEKEHVATTL